MTFRTLTRIIFAVAVGALLLLGQVAHAQTATVTAVGGPDYGSGYIRWDKFSCDLQASFDKKPTPQNEATLTSDTPTWTWNCTTQGFHLTGNQTSDHVTLESTPAPSKSNPLSAGQNSITVTATAHWIDTKGVSYASDPGSVTVKFFVRIPYNVVANGTKTHIVYPNGTGHEDDYPLQIQDNQPSPSGYGNGLPHEDFTHSSTLSPNDGGPGTWGLGVDANGNDTGTGTPSQDLTDHNGEYDSNGGHAANEIDDYFYQPWHCMELTPPYNAPNANLYLNPGQFHIDRPVPPALNNPSGGDFLANVNDTALSGGHGSTHYVINYWGNTQRSWPGQAPY